MTLRNTYDDAPNPPEPRHLTPAEHRALGDPEPILYDDDLLTSLKLDKKQRDALYGEGCHFWIEVETSCNEIGELEYEDHCIYCAGGEAIPEDRLAWWPRYDLYQAGETFARRLVDDANGK